MKLIGLAVLLAVLITPVSSLAHHGGISLALGPGTPIETNSALTLPEKGIVVSARVEHVEFRKRDFAEPENKDSFTFLNLGLSYGIKPYLTANLFLPYNIKRQDSLGSTEGIGDVKFMGALGFHYDPSKGLGLNTAQDTAVIFDETQKTYFSLFGGFTLPTGKSREKLGGSIDRGMQPGFRSPTFTLGMAVTRQLTGSLTLAADTSYELFTQKDSFKFGNEWRLNLAGIYELYGKPEKFLSKIDGILELNLLNIARDEEHGEKLRATGGTILYVSPGLRFSFPKIWNGNLGVLFKFPTWKHLNEKGEQQGSEGLEKFRVIATLSFYF